VLSVQFILADVAMSKSVLRRHAVFTVRVRCVFVCVFVFVNVYVFVYVYVCTSMWAVDLWLLAPPPPPHRTLIWHSTFRNSSARKTRVGRKSYRSFPCALRCASHVNPPPPPPHVAHFPACDFARFSKGMADLSDPVNYANDIHAVAAIIKAYFRELKEPLLVTTWCVPHVILLSSTLCVVSFARPPPRSLAMFPLCCAVPFGLPAFTSRHRACFAFVGIGARRRKCARLLTLLLLLDTTFLQV
jgi:hypothetical protein